MPTPKTEKEILARLDVLVLHLEQTMAELKSSTIDNTKRIGDVENQQMRISEQLVQATILIKENSTSMMDISEKFSALITELQREQISELRPIQEFITKQGVYLRTCEAQVYIGITPGQWPRTILIYFRTLLIHRLLYL